MKKKFYAYLNDENICYAIGDPKKVPAAVKNYVELDCNDISLIGMRYVAGIWEKVESVMPDPEPTEAEIAQAKLDYVVMMEGGK